MLQEWIPAKQPQQHRSYSHGADSCIAATPDMGTRRIGIIAGAMPNDGNLGGYLARKEVLLGKR